MKSALTLHLVLVLLTTTYARAHRDSVSHQHHEKPDEHSHLQNGTISWIDYSMDVNALLLMNGDSS
jgi:hypothetical protein